MPDAPSPPPRRRSWLRRAGWSLVLFLLLLATAVALLPRLLSTAAVRGRVAGALEEQLGRKVQLGQLEYSWAGRLHIGQLQIADDPAFSPEPLFELDTLRIHLAPLDLLRRRLDARVELHGLRAHVIRDAQGRSNLDWLQAEPEAPRRTEAPQEPADRDTALRLPLREIAVQVLLDGIDLHLDDRAQGRSGALRDASLQLQLAPPEHLLQVALRAALEVDGRELPPLGLEVRVADLLQPGGELTPLAAALEAAAELPGVRLQVHTDAQEKDRPARAVTAELQVALEPVLAAVGPFLPPQLLGTEAAGELQLQLSANGDPQQALTFQLAVHGEELRAAGPLLQGRRLGPLTLHLEQDGAYQVPAATLQLSRGELHLQRASQLAWSGSIVDPGSPGGRAEVTLGPASLDLAELHQLAGPYLPPEPQLQWSGGAPQLRWQRITATAPLAAGDTPASADLEVADLHLSLPGLTLSQGVPALEARGVAVAIERLSGQLRHGHPRQFSLRASAHLDALTQAGAVPLAIRGATLPRLDLHLVDLQPSHEVAPMPPGHLELEQELQVAAVRLGEQLQLDDLRQRLRADGELGSDGTLQLALQHLGVSTAQLQYAVDAPPLALQLAGGDDAASALAVEVKGLHCSGTQAEPLRQLDLAALRLHLAGLTLEQGPLQLQAGQAALQLRDVAASLHHSFPREVLARAQLELTALALGGTTDLTLERLELPHLHVRAHQLQPSATSLFGVAGALELDQDLHLTQLRLPGQLSVADLEQQLRLTAHLEDGPRAHLEGTQLHVAAEGVVLPGVGSRDEPPLRTGLQLAAALPALNLTGTAAEAISFEDLQLEAALGQILRLEAQASATALGAEALHSAGALHLDLAALAELPPSLRAGGRFAGQSALHWALDGRLPTPQERQQLIADPLAALSRDTPLPFLHDLNVALTLGDVAADIPGAGPPAIAVAGVSTVPDLHLHLADFGQTLELAADLSARWVERLPGLPPATEPLDLALGVHGSLHGSDRLTLEQTLDAAPLGLRQELHLHLGGLRRLAQLGAETPPPLWLGVLGGDLGLAAHVDAGARLDALTGDLQVAGPLELTATGQLAPARELAASIRLSGQEAALRVGNLLQLEGLQGELELAKHLRIRLVSPATATAQPTAPELGTVTAHQSRFLSEQVLLGAADRAPRASDRHNGAGGGGGLQVRRLHLATAPLPLQLHDLQLQLGLPGGLPALERLQADLLGGTVITGLEVLRSPDSYLLGGELTFTGLDATRLLPQPTPARTPGSRPPGDADADAEISGQFGFHLPFGDDLGELLSTLELQAGLTHVGPRTLDRALYALDPMESNEAILAQRRLLRLGSPRWVALQARQGNLSIAGQVSLAGAPVALPPVERFPLNRLPGLLGIEPTTDALAPLRTALDLVSADELRVQPSGAMHWVHTTGGDLP